MVAQIFWQFMPMLAWWGFGDAPTSFSFVQIHIAHSTLGTLMLLVVLRCLWRLINIHCRRSHLRGLSARAAATAHILLYALTFAIPALVPLRIDGSGWLPGKASVHGSLRE